MSKLRIVIPSHKRHDRVFAKYLVNDPIICVAKSQADIYRDYNPDCEIVAHPDDVVGLIPKRNWMTKHFNEQFAKAYCPRATGVRLHNVYGPAPRKGTLLHNLMNCETCTIYNGGRNVRHFTYIGDAVEALVYASTCNRQLVNVVNPVGNTVREFCDEVAKHMPLNLSYTDDLRPLDNFEQSVNHSIFTLPLPYKSIVEGISQVFEASEDVI